MGDFTKQVTGEGSFEVISVLESPGYFCICTSGDQMS